MTEVEIDNMFERTQPIGNALNALYQAELAVVAVDVVRPDVSMWLDQVLRNVIRGPGD